MEFALYLWEQTKYSHATNDFCEKAYLLIVNEIDILKVLTSDVKLSTVLK